MPRRRHERYRRGAIFDERQLGEGAIAASALVAAGARRRRSPPSGDAADDERGAARRHREVVHWRVGERHVFGDGCHLGSVEQFVDELLERRELARLDEREVVDEEHEVAEARVQVRLGAHLLEHGEVHARHASCTMCA